MGNFGLTVTNANGNIQIDAAYKNYVFLSSGSVTVPLNGPATIPILPSLAEPPLLLINPPAGKPMMIYQYVTSGGLYTGITLYGEWGKAATIVPYKLFTAQEHPITHDTWGMEIYDSAGAPAFSSQYTYLKVADIGAVDLPAGGSGVTWTHAASGGFFLIKGVPGFESFANPPAPSPAEAVYHVRLNSTQVQIIPKVVDILPPGVAVGSLPGLSGITMLTTK